MRMATEWVTLFSESVIMALPLTVPTHKTVATKWNILHLIYNFVVCLYFAIDHPTPDKMLGQGVINVQSSLTIA